MAKERKVRKSLKNIGKKLQESRLSAERIHVVSNSTGWAVKREGATRAYRRFKSKDDAVVSANRLQRNNPSNRIIIHKRDGTVDKWK